MTARAIIAPHASETHRGIVGLLVPRGRRLHPILRLDYFVRVLTYPLYFILFFVALYPNRGTPFFWTLLSFHLFVWPHLALAMASRGRNQKHAEYRNLLVDSLIIGCYLPIASFNLRPCGAALLGIFAGCISVGGWRMGALSALAIAVGAVVVSALFGVHFDPLGGHVWAQGLGVAVMSWVGHRYQVFPSEGGHADFAPQDAVEDALLLWLRAKLGHVSYERIVSGPGLVNIYRFVHGSATQQANEPAKTT